ncbi:10759_t:CDS:2 [Funneliformis geosporum]|uniref:18524_t:CDS:1 n=1 Tax=Funneliformis geosporum TaxID=1117311 RepID=A0A9W4T2X8_9GLOM|nr:10759_t:CDS:2 [Funneliformis geosporum]CAI2188454.1 18524_t:CDS:2 [Funneliformis geosporum]
MSRVLSVFLAILAFFTLQTLAAGTCTITSTADPSAPTATVSVENSEFKPDCLSVYDGQYVEWVWVENGRHTVTSNAGPFGDCNGGQSPVMKINAKGQKKGDKVTSPKAFTYNAKQPEFDYKCFYHCDSDMAGKIEILPKK